MNNILSLINNSQNILILTHQRPDGDAVGSALAMYEALINIGKKVTIVMQDVPEIYNYLKYYDQIKQTTNNSFELGIILDCSTKERIGQLNDLVSKCQKTVCLDHHINNTKYTDINYIEPTTSSCCQLVYYFLKNNHIDITLSIGESIITGVLTDTNGFANNNVDHNTFNLVSELILLGVDFHKLHTKVLRMKSQARFALQKLAMSRLTFLENGQIAFTYLNKIDFIENNAQNGDHEGIVDIGRNIENVAVSVFVREDDGYHVSFRSNGEVDVNAIAQEFNGGGHTMAAGCIINKPFKETKKLLIEEIKKKLG